MKTALLVYVIAPLLSNAAGAASSFVQPFTLIPLGLHCHRSSMLHRTSPCAFRGRWCGLCGSMCFRVMCRLVGWHKEAEYLRVTASFGKGYISSFSELVTYSQWSVAINGAVNHAAGLINQFAAWPSGIFHASMLCVCSKEGTAWAPRCVNHHCCCSSSSPSHRVRAALAVGLKTRPRSRCRLVSSRCLFGWKISLVDLVIHARVQPDVNWC